MKRQLAIYMTYFLCKACNIEHVPVQDGPLNCRI
uniref:Uncharacterized protein n=1 Tax=Arundo donax TaxID=35708 RepID=A0A0A9BDG7_ARUDO